MAEMQFDKAKESIATRIEQKEEPALHLIPYMGYGTKNSIYCKGRLIQDTGVHMSEEDSSWQNLMNTYKRFGTDEIADAKIQFQYNSHKAELLTDQDGYFTLTHNFEKNTRKKTPWHTYDVSLLSAPVPYDNVIQSKGEILIPPTNASLGVISDIDDTIIRTHVTSTMRMLYTTFMKNAFSRKAFPGAAALYWALLQGNTGNRQNPIFYVSNGPWNLYDMLVTFFAYNDIPKGPILLRDFGLHKDEKVIKYKTHKYKSVLNIIQTYPKLPFILIGDSGEKDTDIYLQIAKSFPKRIKAIYIRSVGDAKRDERVEGIMEQEDGIDMLLFEDTDEVAEHAYENGYITKEAYMAVLDSIIEEDENLEEE